VKTDRKVPVSAVCVSIKTHITRTAANAGFSNVVLRNGSKIVKQERENKKKDLTNVIFDEHFLSFTHCCSHVLQKYYEKQPDIEPPASGAMEKSVSRNSLLCNTWNYCHRRYTAKNCGSQTMALYRDTNTIVYSFLVPPYHSAHKLLDCLLSKSTSYV
jgi:hypothetical protein